MKAEAGTEAVSVQQLPAPAPALLPFEPALPELDGLRPDEAMLASWRAQNPAWFAELSSLMSRMPPLPSSRAKVGHVSLAVHIPLKERHVRLLPASTFVNTTPELPACRLCGVTGLGGRELAVGTCGHVMCAACWQRRTDRNLPCPTCKLPPLYTVPLRF